jgi:hypothetical protein
MKTEFHCHTDRSFDCNVGFARRIERYRKLEFEFLFVTDHDRCPPRDWEGNFDGLEIRSGVEVSTYLGHVILLDCRYAPPIGALWFLVVWAYIFKARLYLPHPCRYGTGFLRRCEQRTPPVRYVSWFLRRVEFIEVWNPRDRVGARVTLHHEWYRILEHRKFTVASDSHFDDDMYSPGCPNSGLATNDERVVSFFRERFALGGHKWFSIYHLFRAGLYALAYLFGYRPK